MSALFSVAKLLSKGRKERITKRVGSGSSLLSSKDQDKETPASRSLASSKLPTVVTPAQATSVSQSVYPVPAHADSVVEVLSSDNESMMSFYSTPIAEHLSAQPRPLILGDGKDEHEYAMVSEPKPMEEWTQLELGAPKADTADAVEEERQRGAAELEVTTRKYDAELQLSIEARDRAQALERNAVAAMIAAQEESRNAADALQLMQARAEVAEAELTRTKNTLNTKSQAISNFIDDVKRLSAQIASLEADLKDVRATSDAEIVRLRTLHEKECESHRQEVSHLNDTIDEIFEESNDNSKCVEALRKELAEARQEVQTLTAQNYELETKVLHHEENAAKAASEDAESNIQITMLRDSHSRLATQLVDFQSSLTSMERQNRMLLDQIRQQSDDMSSSKQLRRPPSRGRVNGLAGTMRLDSAVRVIKLLNDEIYQTAASMTDQLESVARFVPVASRRSAAAASLKSVLGTELTRSLEHGHPTRGDDSTFFVQIQTALQASLVACCMRIITSWYAAESEYGTFLAAIYERIRGIEGLETAQQWRKTTLKNSSPPGKLDGKLLNLFVEEVYKVFTLCGWDREGNVAKLTERFSPKLAEIATLAVRLNQWNAAGVFGDNECAIAEPGFIFDSDEMSNDDDLRRSNRRQTVRHMPPKELVICTVGLGIKRARDVDEEEDEFVLKPKVVLYGALF